MLAKQSRLLKIKRNLQECKLFLNFATEVRRMHTSAFETLKLLLIVTHLGYCEISKSVLLAISGPLGIRRGLLCLYLTHSFSQGYQTDYNKVS